MAWSDLVASLTEDGYLVAQWESSFAAVPRHPFIPAQCWAHREDGTVTELDREARPLEWEKAVTSDMALVLAKENGRPTTSASMPRMVAMMLRELDVRDGNTLLEIGAGTGWNSALASHRLGSGSVTTIEVDVHFAERAAARLKAVGFTPRVVWGDGAKGWEAEAPYERFIATCAVQHVPYSWVEQTQGVMVVPWGNGMCNGALLRLESDGRAATGKVVEEASFMWMTGHAPADWPQESEEPEDSEGDRSSTGTDPRVLTPNEARFAVGLGVPGCRYGVDWGDAPKGADCTLWLTDGKSTASVRYMPEGTSFPVRQSGPRRLWHEVEAAYHWWEGQGRPGFGRFGLTVDGDGERAWLDSSDNPLPFQST
ncbi:protein-L-isoaspartate(D-aspartate) O-methyltransferase [Streptomyces sp. UNOC14_S4]|uniref:protein-L-isoaspartate(D-aspartate) O-methyltransferase n=1 Tax=Streptomyces sp. UNOC14_S4 TaxID=2872340 RepID=UPI001E3E225B|nr:protein-L-isoaspartate(D-aspartate) O-methyltransferase [Streptomyces sp. UNOC14_S4]MCC3769813.1 protein-L-isoaspartate(D-aspartate) O-methyltransferase [Streptomyces sp. UNOC14_S4]